MPDFLAFEGPADTLFLVDGGMLRVLTHAGEEVILPWSDLLEFLVHLSVQRAQVLSRLRNPQIRLLVLALRGQQ